MVLPSPVAAIINSVGLPPFTIACSIASPAAFHRRAFRSAIVSMVAPRCFARPSLGGKEEDRREADHHHPQNENTVEVHNCTEDFVAPASPCLTLRWQFRGVP